MKSFHLFKALLLLHLLCFTQRTEAQPELLKCNQGFVTFVSKAKLETIQASSKDLKGVLNTKTSYFAFRLAMKTFQGFNSPLQREHFFENYISLKSNPESIFQGKIIDAPTSWANVGKALLRAKGTLTINGISVERIIEVNIQQQGKTILFECEFLVPLVDHDISIPRIVDQKISKEISVRIKGELN